jgi:hypothetical protein
MSGNIKKLCCVYHLYLYDLQINWRISEKPVFGDTLSLQAAVHFRDVTTGDATLRKSHHSEVVFVRNESLPHLWYKNGLVANALRPAHTTSNETNIFECKTSPEIYGSWLLLAQKLPNEIEQEEEVPNSLILLILH